MKQENCLFTGEAVAVIGAGAWGTAIAWALAMNGHIVRLYARRAEIANGINTSRENSVYLPGAILPDNLLATADMDEAVDGARLVFFAVPSQFMRAALKTFGKHAREDAIVVSAAKGVENESLSLPSEMIRQTLPGPVADRSCFLSGPTFAKELCRKSPTAATIASTDLESAKVAQSALSSSFFRLYVHNDIIGVELGGAVKNVMAIAAGIADGLGFGHNTRAALITRGLMEMSRLGVAMGGDPRTFMGLSGLGDLVLTCTGDLSRNRTVGLRLGQGETLKNILESTRSVAEGVATAISVKGLAQRHNVEMPIAGEVYSALYEGKDPRQAVLDLMARGLKSEF
ncbi:MAG: NAD(P)-dependent glycerol-3-phosphate dehydrogenase [Nitrospinae bacterium]|nr:NAD(P)-dependent glycerol-3-phosphate dehydrogenase [Nitrospinota bacterium]